MFAQLQNTRAFSFQSPVDYIDKLRLKTAKVTLTLAP